MLKRAGLKIIFGVVVLVTGFILLLRGCLAAYDERSAVMPGMYFEKDGKAVVFTIVKFEKATSYKSGGGMTTKSVSTNYYVQINDAVTGEKIDNKKIKHHSDVKNYPITTLGMGNGKAWVFIGEPMAFDPFTLEKVADKKILEEKNPSLKGKMPEQKTYYKYNNITDELIVTATDGLLYSISTATLLATAIDEDDNAKSPLEAKVKALEKEEKNANEQYKQFFENYRNFSQQYRERKITEAAFIDSGRKFNRQQDTINAIRTRIRNEMDDMRDLLNNDKGRQREIDNLRTSSSISLSSMCSNSDTMNGKWYGMLNNTALEKFYHKFEHRNVYEETGRNKFYTSDVKVKDPTRKAIELEVGDPQKVNDAVYLQGGLLLDKATALPIHLKNNDGFIICSREKVGNDGKLIITRIDLTGKAMWTVNTNLDKFLDWIYTGNRLVIFGVDNKELSSGDANVLNIIDLQKGTMVTHDYFKDKMRTK